jgi:hypothetical protein
MSLTNVLPLSQPDNIIYECCFCNIKTHNKKDYNKHILTKKHLKNADLTAFNKSLTKNPQNSQQHNCDFCNKIYKSRVGLWYHKKKCTLKAENITIAVEEEPVPENNQYSTDLILELLKQNQEFKELILEQNKQMLEMSKDRNVTNNNNITQNNNKFNLNVFLNETCKDALNLSDFLESLILSLTDFENFGPLGYCGGISNILVNGLNKLDISKRPIHCSDLKREVIHIKNNDTWHKDDDKQQMIKAIKAIEHKNVKQISLWAKANPEYKDPNHKKSDLYTKLIDQSLCDTDKEKALKNYNKIIRTVAKEILVEKDK